MEISEFPAEDLMYLISEKQEVKEDS